MTDEQATLGPVGYLVVEFSQDTPTGRGLPALVDLVDKGLIRVLDLIFVSKAEDGTTTLVELTDLDGDGTLDLAMFSGASSGMLDDEDVASAGDVLEPGTSGAVLLYENRWAVPFVTALRSAGATLVAAGFVPADELDAWVDMPEVATT
jgi:hypothetical protein